MTVISWIKIATDMFEDEKLLIVESMPECDAILVIWTKLLLRAGKCNAGGWIYLSEGKPYTEDMLAAIFRRPVNVIRLALKTLEALEMIEITDQGIYIVNFASHQNIDGMNKIKEQTRLRVKKFRQKQLGNATVTECNATVTQQNKEEDKEEDKEENIPTKVGAAAPINPWGCCITFEDYKNLIDTYQDQVAFLVCAFKRIHHTAPASDFEGLGGRLGKLWANNNRDTGFILQVMWDISSKCPAGSHLNYLEKTLKGRRENPGNNGHNLRTDNDPNKYTAGKYGHVVKS